jgi:hypothetical protein
LPPAIHYRHRSRSSIQCLYLRHRFFITVYLSRKPPSETHNAIRFFFFITVYLSRKPSSETHNAIQPQHFSPDSINQLTCRLSLSAILDTALFDFRAATMRLDNTINAIEDALENDTSHSDLPSSPFIDSIEHDLAWPSHSSWTTNSSVSM